MTKHLESYQVSNMELSVEDYKQRLKKGETHFIPQIKHKRYKGWVNGGGIGESDTLDGVRQILFDYANARLSEEIKELTEKLCRRFQAQQQLTTVDNLQSFRIIVYPYADESKRGN